MPTASAAPATIPMNRRRRTPMRVVTEEVADKWQSIGVGPFGLWIDRGALYAQRVAASGEISGIDLPTKVDSLKASGQNGHVMAFNDVSIWLVNSKGAAATLFLWEISGATDFNLAAASAAGGLLVSAGAPSVTRTPRKRSNSSLHFFPLQPLEPARSVERRPDANAGDPSLITVTLSDNPDEIAMNDAGFIAVRTGTMLSLYEPLSRLGLGQSGMGANMNAASEGSARPTLKAEPRAHYSRTWLPATNYEVWSALEALVSEDPDTFNRLRRPMQENIRVPARDVANGTGLAPEQSELISAIFALDTAAVNASTVSVNFHLPESGISPLHLACDRTEPGNLIGALLARGADPNTGDRFGRTAAVRRRFCPGRWTHAGTIARRRRRSVSQRHGKRSRRRAFGGRALSRTYR